MQQDAKLSDEPARLAALDRYRVLDTPREQGFEKITTLVRQILDTPVCAVTLIDRERQWIKSIQGGEQAETPRSVAFCDHTIRLREPLVVPDATKDPRFAANPLVTDGPKIRSYAGVPLSSPDGYNLGALCVVDMKPREFTAGEVDILRKFAGLVMDELELRTIAHRDFLTGTLTRRAFIDVAKRDIDRCRREDRSSAIASFDIDHFKRINDGYGHPFGDEVLKAVAEACEATLRPTDMLGRLGGEEFGILLVDTALDDAVTGAERVRLRIAALEFPAVPGLTVTASFGVAALAPDADLPAWMAIADEALYDAKREGRDRIVARRG